MAALIGIGLYGQTTLTSGTYTGQSYPGDVIIASGNTVTFSGGTTFAGVNLTLNSSAILNWDQNDVLAGKVVVFNSGANLTAGAGNTLTFDSISTASGDLSIISSNAGASFINQGSLTHSVSFNNGSLYAPTFTNQGAITSTGASSTLFLGNSASELFTNAASGTITADGTNVVINLLGVDNQGTLLAQNNGQLRFSGPNTTAELGNVQVASGGRALLNGTLDNSSATLSAITGGTFELFGGTIDGGTIAALGFTTSGGTVNNASFTGAVTHATSSSVTFSGTTSYTGATATFASAGSVNIGASGTFTVDSASTVSGDLSIASTAAGASFINQGSLTHNVSFNNGSLYAPTFTNQGAITATGASSTLFLGNSASELFTNAASGTITQAGGTISLGSGLFTNLGTIDVQTGTFQAGSNLHDALGGLIKGSGTINGDLFVDGGTLAPGSSIGTLTFTNTDFTTTTASVLQIELSGSSSDQLVFQNPTSVVNIGTGLLDLNLVLLGAPTLSATYNLLSISSGGSGISGYFAGLPNSGDLLTASYLGTPYSFSVSYSTNTIQLATVPEPGMAALLGAGLGWLIVRGMRRRRG
ncbi:MAG: hypothetical protein A3G75_09205 [Verrucomicrobia bacterium RIFCSPLOWO2_12_FULL_64_8]|nr:MAG: hypothetical protein A3G75_09205 [Verrucomicrobia bacterium RIFCSPLOWO2_12_FULL_64_8]